MKLKEEDHIEEIDDIRNYRPIHNKVVVKQLTDNTIKRIADVEIVFPTHVRIGKVAARNAVRYGEVISVPEKYVSRGSGKYQTRWDTDIEIQPGDIVWCESTGLHKAERFVDDQGNLYYVVDYQHLVVAKRNGEVIMLNGRILLDLVEKPSKSLIHTSRHPTFICRVVHTGSSNSNYRFPGFEDPDIKVGDLVCIPPTKYFQLEDSLWRAFGGNYYYTQKHQIVGIIEDKEEEKAEKEQADNS